MNDATSLAQWCEIALKERRDKRAVLFIDQFEEVFTQINNETERQAFLNMLTYAATVESGRVIVLFAMRSDFVSNCATYPQLNALLNQQFIQIGAMQPDELVSAIAQPALRVGLRIDPDLIAQIIDQRGALEARAKTEQRTRVTQQHGSSNAAPMPTFGSHGTTRLRLALRVISTIAR